MMKIMTHDDTLSRNLRFLRAKYRLSQRSLALLAGISPPILRQIEDMALITVIASNTLKRLCQIFDMDPDTLVRTDLSARTDTSCDRVDGL